MKTSICLTCICLFFTVVPLLVFSTPEQLNDNQMTDMAVEEKVTKSDSPDKEHRSQSKLKTERHYDDIYDGNVIMNPMEDPSELSRIEELRLDTQPKERFVNDQINEINQGLHRTPGSD